MVVLDGCRRAQEGGHKKPVHDEPAFLMAICPLDILKQPKAFLRQRLGKRHWQALVPEAVQRDLFT